MSITEETARASTAQRASVHDSGAFSPAQYCIVLPADFYWMTLLTAFISEKSLNGIMNRLKTFRRLSLKPFHTFQAFSKKTVYGRVEQLKSKTKRSKNYVPPIAMLPDDVLIDIFVLAATTLEDKAAVSLVCRRFRGVIMSMRKMWDGYWIESDQTPEQIIAIAEGNGFTSLKARIKWPDATESLPGDRMLSYKFSLRLILSLGPEELEINPETPEGFQFHCLGCLFGFDPPMSLVLAGGSLQNLHKLAIRNSQNWFRICKHEKPDMALVLEEFTLPHLHTLDVDFVPGAALARSVVRCSLRGIEEADTDSLKEFLAAAKSLQDLQFFLSENARRFYEACDLPSLRSLEVNFVPHPSLARHLTRFRLSLPSYWYLSLTKLLDFLSSSDALEELAIDDSGECHGFVEDASNVFPVVTMPTVVSCEILGLPPLGPTLVAKVRMPILQTLKLDLRRLSKLSTVIRNAFHTSLRSMSSLEVLELNGEVDMDHMDTVIRYAPPHLESFSLNGCMLAFNGEVRWTTSRAPNRKLVRFTNCKNFDSVSIHMLVDYLGNVGLGGVKIQVSACEGWRDGTFGLYDVMSARVDT